MLTLLNESTRSWLLIIGLWEEDEGTVGSWSSSMSTSAVVVGGGAGVTGAGGPSALKGKSGVVIESGAKVGDKEENGDQNANEL